MASKKTNKVTLSCSECKRYNYRTNKSKKFLILDPKAKLALKKYCRHCKKATLHLETKIKKGKKK